MPTKISKVGDNRYRVSTPSSVHSKGTTLRKAKAQQRLLNAIDHGWEPSERKRKRKGRR